ncbi:SRPBCC family protein [Streptomyces rubiginosohelvolus]|uniref:SRPBCC family protein n=1 Tax=Streptomyces rubiginosohelvolus TaxID=67362 RepID=UPI0036571D5A
MAIRHRLIERPAADVWAVLADPTRYGDWVVGTSKSSPEAGSWPEVGAAITYTVRLGRWSAQGRTTVRRCEAPHVLELEAESGWLGTARIALKVRPWGRNTLVIIDEHPLRGPAAKLHNTVIDAFVQVRHRSMLAHLAEAVDKTPRREHHRV